MGQKYSDIEMGDVSSGDFVVVRVYTKDKKSFRLYVARVKKSVSNGYEGVFYKRAQKTLRFLETEEEAFFSKTDIVRKLSKPVTSSIARFKNMISFNTDLSDLTLV